MPPIALGSPRSCSTTHSIPPHWQLGYHIFENTALFVTLMKTIDPEKIPRMHAWLVSKGTSSQPPLSDFWQHMRQSLPDSGLRFQVSVLKTFDVFLSLLESGRVEQN